MFDVAPLRIECTNHSETHGRYEIEPLEEGYGVTLGNSLRRILLSSLPGAAITSLKMDEIKHEFSDIPHALEDVTEFVLNLKKVRFKNHAKTPMSIELDVAGSLDGVREITAADLTFPSQIEVVNPDQYLLTLDGPDATLHAEMTVDYGKGYLAIEGRDSNEIGTIPVDAVFAPIRRVNYFIERKRVGQMTNFERLVLEVWTDGSIDPTDAVSQSAEILTRYFQQVADFSKQILPPDKQPPLVGQVPPHLYDMPIESLDLTPRAFNSLKRANITKVGEVLEMSEDELLSIRNFGRKSLDELRERLALHNYLSMDQVSAFSQGDLEGGDYYDNEEDNE